MALGFPPVGLRAMLFGCCLVGLTACGGHGVLPENAGRNDVQRFTQRTLATAGREFDAGDLAGALKHYQIVNTLNPEDTGLLRRIGYVRSLIRQRSGHHQVAAQRALKSGQPGLARTELLKALSLEPDNRRVLALLARIETDRASAALHKRQPTIDPAYRDPADMEKTLAPPKPVAGVQSLKTSRGAAGGRHAPVVNTRLVALLRRNPVGDGDRHRLIGDLIALGDKLFAQGNATDALRCLDRAQSLGGGNVATRDGVVALKNVYASRLYRQAISAQGRNRQKAIRLLRLALRYRPEYAKARLRLKRLSAAGSSSGRNR